MAMVEQQGMRRKKAQVSKGRRERIPSFIGEEGAAPRGCAGPYRCHLSLFMVVTPSST
jgi:hypothetical protein